MADHLIANGRIGLNATPKWMGMPNAPHHFQLSEPAMITEYANSALQLFVD